MSIDKKIESLNAGIQKMSLQKEALKITKIFNFSPAFAETVLDEIEEMSSKSVSAYTELLNKIKEIRNF